MRPAHEHAHLNLGVALRSSGRLDEAIASYRRALACNPRLSSAHKNLGNALAADHQLAEAELSYRRTLELDPGNADALMALGHMLTRMLRLDEAIAMERRALELDPGFARAHSNLGFALLTRGDLAAGWPEYEWRLRDPEQPIAPYVFPVPTWQGEDPAGRTILLHHEQGFGDTLHFARYAPLLAARGAKVIVLCQPELKRLLQCLPGVTVVTPDSSVSKLDFCLSLASAPFVFGTTLDTIPGKTPYLAAEPQLVREWRARVAEDDAMKIGVVWAGKPSHASDRLRSLPLAAFAPLAQVPGTRFYSLQTGEPAQSQDPPARLPLVDLTPDIADFADTAALIENLDLVIAADTAVVHLAGALGKPVWLLCRFESEWRWMLGREDSPWYPTMRIFRQWRAGDWTDVMERVARALRTRSAAPATRTP